MVMGRKDKEKDDSRVSSWASGVGGGYPQQKKRRNGFEGKDGELSFALKLELPVRLPGAEPGKPLHT